MWSARHPFSISENGTEPFGPNFPKSSGCGKGPASLADPHNSYEVSAGLVGLFRGFWERDLKARSAVPRLTPSLSAIWFQEKPRERRPATWRGSTSTRGRPRALPCRRALLIPIWTRSLIRLRSNSATAPNTVSSFWRARLTFSRMSLAVAVQMKGLGSSL